MSKVLSVYTEKYTDYVIENLVDIKGKSKSDVVNFILKDWIGDHQIELDGMDISIKQARKQNVV